MSYEERAANRRRTWQYGLVHMGDEAERLDADFLRESTHSERLDAVLELSLRWCDAETGTRVQRFAYGVRKA